MIEEDPSVKPTKSVESTDRSLSYRLYLIWYRLIGHLNLGVSMLYVGVASALGVDALILLLGAATIWPVGIGVVVLLLASAYFVRERMRGVSRRRRSSR